MPVYAAELNGVSVVRVVVAPSLQWCVDNLGGAWVETADPYSEQPDAVGYCGPGWGFDDRWPVRFAPPWQRPGDDRDEVTDDFIGGLRRGDRVFHAGRIWISLSDLNVLSPDEGDWIDTPTTPDALPTSTVRKGRWTNDTAYIVGDIVWNLEGIHRCIQAHQSRLINRPGGSQGSKFWTTLIQRGV